MSRDNWQQPIVTTQLVGSGGLLSVTMTGFNYLALQWETNRDPLKQTYSFIVLTYIEFCNSQQKPVGLISVTVGFLWEMKINESFDSYDCLIHALLSNLNGIFVLWCLTPRSPIFQLCRGVQFYCIGGGNRSTQRKPPTCRKSLTNFIS